MIAYLVVKIYCVLEYYDCKSKPGFIILLCVFWVDERLLKKMKVNKGLLPRAFDHYKSCLSVERTKELHRLQ